MDCKLLVNFIRFFPGSQNRLFDLTFDSLRKMPIGFKAWLTSGGEARCLCVAVLKLNGDR